ncbi:hypothetical protein [Embleya sp. NBC_00896]|uniref:hypothetical protein n=1 Tax=Embleya sp. NBC_00896 TaxID=2975961 RepID=UPI00386F9AAE|nr:hypothetical protein OG928_31630 [Embleya sp. NBC_00896]
MTDTRGAPTTDADLQVQQRVEGGGRVTTDQAVAAAGRSISDQGRMSGDQVDRLTRTEQERASTLAEQDAVDRPGRAAGVAGDVAAEGARSVERPTRESSRSAAVLAAATVASGFGPTDLLRDDRGRARRQEAAPAARAHDARGLTVGLDD